MRQDPKRVFRRVFRGRAPEDRNPGHPSTSSAEAVNIWGEMFSLVPNGLDPHQVERHIDELRAQINRVLEEKEKSGLTSTATTYLQKVMGEIHQIEETMTSQIRHDAETEATRIVTEAREEARKIVAQARQEAAHVASQETEGILNATRKKAEAAEGQIRLQVQLIREKAQEQLRNYIRQEGTEAHRRLLATLQELSREAQQIEEDWKRQASRLWDEADFRVVLEEERSSAGTGKERNG